MADKAKAARQAGKTTLAKPKHIDASAEYQPIEAIELMRPTTLTTIAASITKGVEHDTSGQAIARRILTMWMLYRTTKQNAYNAPNWAQLIHGNGDRSLTDLGKAFVKRITLDTIGAAPKAKASKDSEPTKLELDATQAYRTRKTALDRAAKLAIAIGYYHGNTAAWEAPGKFLNVPLDIFLPRFRNPKAVAWAFRYEHSGGGNALLDNTFYYMERKLPGKAEERRKGKLSMIEALSRFYSPYADAPATQGADQNKTAQFTKEEIAKVLKVADFGDMIVRAAAQIAEDKTIAGNELLGDTGAKIDAAIAVLSKWRVDVHAASKAKINNPAAAKPTPTNGTAPALPAAAAA